MTDPNLGTTTKNYINLVGSQLIFPPALTRVGVAENSEYAYVVGGVIYGTLYFFIFKNNTNINVFQIFLY